MLEDPGSLGVEGVEPLEGVQPDQPVTDERLAVALQSAGQVDQGRPLAADATGVFGRAGPGELAGGAVEVARDGSGVGGGAHLAASGEGPFVGEGGVGDRPAVALAADEVVGDHPGVGDEHLIEIRPPGHFLERPDLDARLAQVDQEVRDAGVLGNVHVGPGQQDGLVGDLTL